MPSLFYKATLERRFPLPFLFFEDVGIAAEGLDEEPTEEDIALHIRESLKRCCNRKASDADVQYVAGRLEQLAKESTEKQAEEDENKSVKKKAQGFAVSFSDWVGKLKPQELCLAVTDYDHPAAMQLYCEVDRDDVMEMAAQWMAHEWESIKVGYESVVYGFGGGYKEDSAATVIDVSTDDNTDGKVINPAALAAVRF